MSSEEQKVNAEEVNADTVNAQAEEVAEQETVAVDAVQGDADSRIAELEAQLAAAQAKVTEQQDSVLRAKAEMENIRRRASLDVEKAHKFALDKFAEALVPVIDSMELALSHADHESEALKPMIEGVELTLKSMLAAVEKFGILPIDPKDAPFDPEKHQAVSMQEVPGVAANTVIAVMQKGYELNGRLIRPAMVMVSKAAAIDTQA